MQSTDHDRRSTSNMERHLQTILITFITGSIVFAANYFFTDKESKAVLLTNVSHLTSQVAEMRADIRTMRAEQANKGHVEALELRVRTLENLAASEKKAGR